MAVAKKPHSTRVNIFIFRANACGAVFSPASRLAQMCSCGSIDRSQGRRTLPPPRHTAFQWKPFLCVLLFALFWYFFFSTDSSDPFSRLPRQSAVFSKWTQMANITFCLPREVAIRNSLSLTSRSPFSGVNSAHITSACMRTVRIFSDLDFPPLSLSLPFHVRHRRFHWFHLLSVLAYKIVPHFTFNNLKAIRKMINNNFPLFRLSSGERCRHHCQCCSSSLSHHLKTVFAHRRRHDTLPCLVTHNYYLLSALHRHTSCTWRHLQRTLARSLRVSYILGNVDAKIIRVCCQSNYTLISLVHSHRTSK